MPGAVRVPKLAGCPRKIKGCKAKLFSHQNSLDSDHWCWININSRYWFRSIPAIIPAKIPLNHHKIPAIIPAKIPLNHHKIPAIIPAKIPLNWCSSTVHSWDCRSPKTSKKHAKNIKKHGKIAVFEANFNHPIISCSAVFCEAMTNRRRDPTSPLRTSWQSDEQFLVSPSTLCWAQQWDVPSGPECPGLRWFLMIFADFCCTYLHVV